MSDEAREKVFFHAWNLFPEIGPKRFEKLLAGFPSLEHAWGASERELERAGIEPPVIEALRKRSDINPETEWEKLRELGTSVMTISDDSYPPLLKEIHLPPPILYIKGDIRPEDRLAIAIVGTRFCSYYGKVITPRFSGELARAGLTIVSGLAKGIDILAHQEALLSDGRTIAVVGSGFDRESFYPSEHWDFAKDIARQGALLTEFPPGVPALPRHFPQRNRIIAGLSLGVLVIEAPEKSGALLTAEIALEQNRTVYAVPGPITARSSEGTNALIKLGAKPITEASEILEDLRLQAMPVSARSIELKDPNEKAVFEHLSAEEPIHVDELAKNLRMPSGSLNATLAVLEVRGLIRNLGSNYFIRA